MYKIVATTAMPSPPRAPLTPHEERLAQCVCATVCLQLKIDYPTDPANHSLPEVRVWDYIHTLPRGTLEDFFRTEETKDKILAECSLMYGTDSLKPAAPNQCPLDTLRLTTLAMLCGVFGMSIASDDETQTYDRRLDKLHNALSQPGSFKTKDLIEIITTPRKFKTINGLFPRHYPGVTHFCKEVDIDIAKLKEVTTIRERHALGAVLKSHLFDISPEHAATTDLTLALRRYDQQKEQFDLEKSTVKTAPNAPATLATLQLDPSETLKMAMVQNLVLAICAYLDIPTSDPTSSTPTYHPDITAFASLVELSDLNDILKCSYPGSKECLTVIMTCATLYREYSNGTSPIATALQTLGVAQEDVPLSRLKKMVQALKQDQYVSPQDLCKAYHEGLATPIEASTSIPDSLLLKVFIQRVAAYLLLNPGDKEVQKAAQALYILFSAKEPQDTTVAMCVTASFTPNGMKRLFLSGVNGNFFKEFFQQAQVDLETPPTKATGEALKCGLLSFYAPEEEALPSDVLRAIMMSIVTDIKEKEEREEKDKVAAEQRASLKAAAAQAATARAATQPRVAPTPAAPATTPEATTLPAPAATPTSRTSTPTATTLPAPADSPPSLGVDGLTVPSTAAAAVITRLCQETGVSFTEANLASLKAEVTSAALDQPLEVTKLFVQHYAEQVGKKADFIIAVERLNPLTRDGLLRMVAYFKNPTGPGPRAGQSEVGYLRALHDNVTVVKQQQAPAVTKPTGAVSAQRPATAGTDDCMLARPPLCHNTGLTVTERRQAAQAAQEDILARALLEQRAGGAATATTVHRAPSPGMPTSSQGGVDYFDEQDAKSPFSSGTSTPSPTATSAASTTKEAQKQDAIDSLIAKFCTQAGIQNDDKTSLSRTALEDYSLDRLQDPTDPSLFKTFAGNYCPIMILMPDGNLRRGSAIDLVLTTVPEQSQGEASLLALVQHTSRMDMPLFFPASSLLSLQYELTAIAESATAATATAAAATATAATATAAAELRPQTTLGHIIATLIDPITNSQDLQAAIDLLMNLDRETLQHHDLSDLDRIVRILDHPNAKFSEIQRNIWDLLLRMLSVDCNPGDHSHQTDAFFNPERTTSALEALNKALNALKSEIENPRSCNPESQAQLTQMQETLTNLARKCRLPFVDGRMGKPFEGILWALK